MSACKAYEALVSAFLDHQLSQEDEQKLQQHLDSCPECRAYLADQLAIREALSSLDDEAPAGLFDSVMEKVSVTAQEKPKRIAFLRYWRTVAALAACFAVVASAGLFFDSLRMGRSSSSTSSASYDTAETVTGAAPQSIEETTTETASDQPTDSVTAEEGQVTAALTTSSDLAKTWVEENLGETWTPGETYELTQEQFTALETLLSDAGEAYVLTGDVSSAAEYVLGAE
jgi:hypothetical protein